MTILYDGAKWFQNIQMVIHGSCNLWSDKQVKSRRVRSFRTRR